MARRTLKATIKRAKRKARRIVRRMRGEWIVFAEYKGGPDERDEILELASGSLSAGSGYDFIRGVRDLNWEFTTESAARRAVSRISWIRGVRTRVVGPPYVRVPRGKKGGRR